MRRASRRIVVVVVVDPEGSVLAETEGVLARLGVTVLTTPVSLDQAVELAGGDALDILAVARIRGPSSSLAADLLRRVRELDPAATTVLVGFAESPTVAESLAAALASHRDTRSRGNASGRGSSPSANDPPLTRRELEVLRLVARGHSNDEVARMLWLSRETVKFHLANTYRKLGVGSRQEAAKIAAARGLLPDPPLVEFAETGRFRR